MHLITATGFTTDKEKILIANKLLIALHKKDWELMSSLISMNATWSFPGKNSLSGIAKGAQEVIAKAQQVMSYNLCCRLNNIQVSYMGFALSMHCDDFEATSRIKQDFAVVCALQDGKICAIKTYLSDVADMDEFFGGRAQDEIKMNDLCANFEQCKMIANAFLTSMKSNNWALMHSLMLPDIEWTLPGKSLLSGPAKGVDAVIRRAQSLKKFGVTFNLLYIMYGWNGVALSLYNTGQRKDLVLAEFVTIVFKLDGENIAGLTTHLSDVQGIEQFFIPGIID